MDRRDFIKTTALAVMAAHVGAGVSASPNAQADDESKRWTEELWQRGERRKYRGEELRHIAFPLGGIGAGQVFLTGRGRLEQWQIVNNFNSRANVPGAFFGIWTRTKDGKTMARLLQESSTGILPVTTAVEFSGEYPFAWLRYLDRELPVDVSSEAFSPFIPLNTKDSGLPVVVFRFTVRNHSSQPVDAALMASAPNLVGWDGYAPLNDGRHADYMGNFNTVQRAGNATMLHMQTQEGIVHRLSESRNLFTNDNNVAYLMRLCDNAKVHFGNPPFMPQDVSSAVFWLNDLPLQSSENFLRSMLDAVQAGASLIIAGEGELLEALTSDPSPAQQERGDIVFENWESGSYANWTLTGDCFGAKPATGTLPNQQRVSGWRGRFFVNTYVNGDGTTGRATSRPFKIERKYVHLLVGGGSHRGETCVNLKVGNAIVATAHGDDTERLQPVRWDVSAHVGKTAVIEIVDTNTGGWGHVLVDDIVFSDSPRSPFVDAAVMQRFEEAMPFSWTIRSNDFSRYEIKRDSPILNGITAKSVTARARQFDGLKLKTDARVLLEAENNTLLVIAGRYGKGSVIVCNGAPQNWLEGVDKKTIIGNLIAQASGVAYKPQTGWNDKSPLWGSMALAVVGQGTRDRGHEISVLPQWDDLAQLWNDFAEDGKFNPPTSAEPSAPGRTWNGALSVPLSLKPNEEKTVTFVMAWHFPNRTRDGRYGWGPPPYQYDHRLGNQYNNWFKNAAEVVNYIADNFERLERETKLFHQTFYDSTLPRWLLDCVTANASLIRSPIYVWLEDGTFAGYEGADACCPMNCTHVYNYAMSTAFLFPALERNVRETDLKVQMHPTEHFIPHRTILPLSLPRLQNAIGGPHHHALDGELGTILKTYREWRLCGDGDWLRKLWSYVKDVMNHVMRDHDADGDGVIKGEQPNTYDTHLFGSNTFIGTLYLAALRATEEMAKTMGDAEFLARCRERFEKGKAGYDHTCWNGEYYFNVYDAPNATPQTYNAHNCFGPGCHSDQLLGQWWAHVLGLGGVLPTERVHQALRAIHKHNWLPDLSRHVHRQRVFAEGKEKGLLCCSWPQGGRPQNPILYCDEVWTGIEYHVAATLIYEGMVEEGLQIAKGARDRYTGNQRNPWAEIECGHHYSRAMSSYSLLPAVSGFNYDAASGSLSFAPRLTPINFKTFFTAANGWGSFSQQKTQDATRHTISVKHGTLTLNRLTLELPASAGAETKATVRVGRRVVKSDVKYEGKKCHLSFVLPLVLREGQGMEVSVRL